MGNPGEYHLLSAAEKRRFAIDRIREPDIACPHCGTRTLVKDLVAHIAERCPGQAPVHGRAAWVPWHQALALGVKRHTMSRWVRSGRVRCRGTRGRREYLLRDIVSAIAMRRRTVRPNATRSNDPPKAPEKRLTKSRGKRHTLGMADPLQPQLMRRLKRFAEKKGGYEPTSRALDISATTIKRALTGGTVRRGTASLIEMQLDRAEQK